MDISRVKETAFLSGVIDENSDFAPLLLQPWLTNIDFSGVQRINSVGLRSWMLFISAWADKPLNYLNCPVAISDHLSMISFLLGSPKRVVKVLSAMLPYDCLKCNHTEDLMVKYEDVRPVTLPAVSAPRCRICLGEMEPLDPVHLSIF
jgi:hypothetical protein